MMGRRCPVHGRGPAWHLARGTGWTTRTGKRPTFFEDDRQIPGATFGEDVRFLPGLVHEVYDEARRCMSVRAYTAAVLACRKLLMSVAVAVGAQRNQAKAGGIESNP